ncbi:sugar transferase [Chryseobacterium sp. G0162]|uniref:sugar transferase n=1 Tax=Chryseobacterium sp. G0162 TaxID=2487063 RepID=UPI000F4DF70A|nr:sugar transferase [Chryseobacterium sp. G0162]AZB07639.1 sugar transferase [Chryseobacterium sp. G0162]
MYRHFFKHLFDFIMAVIGLMILSPIFIIIFIGLYIVNDGYPFFFQERPGLNGKIFNIIKFRTMNNKRDVHGKLLEDAQRLTRVGRIVRKTSLDEIPQLINVLKGEMSIVGPRPFLPNYLPLYSEQQMRRHEIRPGITGWAQINGRNLISYTKKIELDIWYVDHVSFVLDAKILILTLKKVFKSEGVSQIGHVTADDFNGYN